MEFSTIDNSARLAKCAENEALLARLARKLNQDGIKPYQLPSDEFHAYIEAAIDAARVPSERGKQRTGDVDKPDDDDELVEPAPAPSPAPADGLKTPAQAARRLGVSIRTLRGLVSTGDLRYVNVGRGKQREKIMFTDNDLNDLIASRTRQKAQESCPSTSPKARRSTTSTSSGAVLVFTARRNGQTGGKRKR